MRVLHYESVSHVGSWAFGIVLEDKPSHHQKQSQHSLQHDNKMNLTRSCRVQLALLEKVLVEFDEQPSNYVLNISALVPIASLETHGYQGQDIFGLVVTAVLSIVEASYPTTRDKLKHEALCTHCINSNYQPYLDNPTVYQAEELVAKFMEGESRVSCPHLTASLTSSTTTSSSLSEPSSTVSLSDLCPDVCLSRIPILQDKDVTVISTLGRGAFGTVSLGLVRLSDSSIPSPLVDHENQHVRRVAIKEMIFTEIDDAQTKQEKVRSFGARSSSPVSSSPPSLSPPLPQSV